MAATTGPLFTPIDAGLPRELAPGVFWLGECLRYKFQDTFLHGANSARGDDVGFPAKDSAQCFQHGRPQNLSGEKFDGVRTRLQQSEGFGRVEETRDGNETGSFCRAHNFGVCVRGDYHAATGICNLPNL